MTPLVEAARRLLHPLAAVVFPTTCPACRAPVERPLDGPLCAACWRTLPHARGMRCACGTPVPDGAPSARCGRCRRGLTPIVAGASLGPHEGPLRVLVHELKYRGRRRLAGRLAILLLERGDVRTVLGGSHGLVPVPLHPRRLRERGFNQCLLLAQALGRGADLPALDVLRRTRDTPSQAGLTAAARRANVRGAFAVGDPARIRGRIVVLVDDVETTGATARACAAALRTAGAAEVRLLTVARVP